MKTTRRHGVSIAEVAISSLLVATIMIASLKSLGMVNRTWGVAANSGTGNTLASDLLAEVNSTAYRDPEDPSKFMGLNSGESGTNRMDFDDIDDFDDWSASPPQSRDGTSLTDYVGWTRAVDIKKVEADDPLSERNDNATDEGLRKITVTVTDPAGNTSVLVVFRSEVELPTPADANVVTKVGISLQSGEMTRPSVDGVTLPNHVEDSP